MKRLLIIFTALLLVSCSAEHTDLSSTGSGSFTKNPSPNPTIVANAKAALETSCGSCHNESNGSVGSYRFLSGTASNIDMDSFVDSSYVRIGIPSGSGVLSSFANMPPGSPLGTSSAEAEAVRAWIEEMGIFVGGSGITFTQVWATTFEPKCLDCHSSTAVGGPGGGVAFDNYDDLVESIVVPGSSATSLLVDSIENRMPKETRASSGKVTNVNHEYYVSDADLSDIIDWIDDGAPNN